MYIIYVLIQIHIYVYIHAFLNKYMHIYTGKEDQPKFWSAEEYIEYLNNFANKFELFKYINFSHDVLSVQKSEGKWIVRVKGGRGMYIYMCVIRFIDLYIYA
jgi:cation diffusion facilitator CzcD-associated flavoprotein CzcO